MLRNRRLLSNTAAMSALLKFFIIQCLNCHFGLVDYSRGCYPLLNLAISAELPFN